MHLSTKPPIHSPNKAAPIDGQPWLRSCECLVAVCLLLKVALELPAFGELYGSRGFAHDYIGRELAVALAPHYGWLDALAPGGELRWTVAVAAQSVAVACALGLLCGRFPLIAALGGWFCQVVNLNSTPLTSYGGDGFLLTVTFYLLVFEVVRRSGGSLAWPVRAAKIHLAIVYLASGVAKLRGEQWLSGEAVWLAIQQPQFSTTFSALVKPGPLADVFSRLATWATLVFEIGFPLAAFCRAWKIAAVSAVLFHIGIGAFLGLWYFVAVMSCFIWIAFLSDVSRLPWWRQAPGDALRRVRVATRNDEVLAPRPLGIGPTT